MLTIIIILFVFLSVLGMLATDSIEYEAEQHKARAKRKSKHRAKQKRGTKEW